MRSEADFKRDFKRSIAYNHKGYVVSLAGCTISGVPDMYVVMPGYAPILIEAKFFKNELTKYFSKRIPYRPSQQFMMQRIDDVSIGTVWGLTGFKYEGQWYCTLTAPIIHSISYLFRDTCNWCTYDNKNKRFDTEKLFATANIPKIPAKTRTPDLSQEPRIVQSSFDDPILAVRNNPT
jgi:hypothetical protein